LAKKIREINETSQNTTFIPESFNGSTKPFCLHTATIDERTILVVAIRGTKTLIEWMANTNVEAVECKELGDNMKCHRGFVNVAKNMQSLLAEVLEKNLVREANILFTGHSGGAAVAQLLFAFMHSNSSPLARFKSGKYSDAYGRFQMTYCAS
jgi:predicted lipase